MSEPNVYDVGDEVEIQLAPASGNGPGDPGTITLHIVKPDHTLHDTYTYAAGEVTREMGRGAFPADQPVYFRLFVIPSAGTWRYRWETTAPIIGAEQGYFVARPSVVPAP
jgi:hypothetical protein